MKGYLLILTSGVLFFIIAVITVLHLMSAKVLHQQYALNESYQDVLNRLSIESIVSYFIDRNIEFIQLPQPLSSRYGLTNQLNTDGSVDFSVEDLQTNRITTFNVSKIQSQASQSSFDALNIAISNDVVSGIHISSPVTTHLVSLRTVWYPFESSDILTHYSFFNNDGDEERVTVNVVMGEEHVLTAPRSSLNRQMTLYFTSLSEAGVVSIYLKYSDGSIQNAHIEY